MASSKKLLCVGLGCLDIVFYAHKYPEEDKDIRVGSHRWSKGGNAANSCSVLNELGVASEFLGVMYTGVEARFLQEEFDKDNIDTSHCPRAEGITTPTSVVITNEQTGSRTILHSSCAHPEISIEDFRKLNLDHYSWIHFEGRPREGIDEIIEMLRYIDEYNKTAERRIPTSVEIEKFVPKMETLRDKADVVFVSKDFAQASGYNNMTQTISEMHPTCRPGSTMICAWGDHGASGRSWNGDIITVPAVPPSSGLVETLAAGDTFNATVLAALVKKKSLLAALEDGCVVAGAKCGMKGIRGLGLKLKAQNFEL